MKWSLQAPAQSAHSQEVHSQPSPPLVRMPGALLLPKLKRARSQGRLQFPIAGKRLLSGAELRRAS